MLPHFCLWSTGFKLWNCDLLKMAELICGVDTVLDTDTNTRPCLTNFSMALLCLGASEPKNMIYMSRLGIWGDGTPFRAFDDFLHAIEKRSVRSFEVEITLVVLT